VIIPKRQDAGAPSQHDPNETPDQIWEDDLTINTPQDEDQARRTARRARNQRREERRVRAAEHARINPRDLNREFDNVADPTFNIHIATMAEATMRLYAAASKSRNRAHNSTHLQCCRTTRAAKPLVITPWYSIQLHKQVALQEAVIVNNKTKESKRSKKWLAASVLGVDNPQLIKLQETNKTATTATDTTMRK
jgi:hypothetical protein